MKITLEVPDSRAEFLLELLQSLPYVKLSGPAAEAQAPDETAHLLASPTNAARLRAAIERDCRGERETHDFLANI
ncbi:MAG: hypothetical protein EOO57_06570 [Hymenobacter sp.]|nr:MAG: hypothetical protein EOO57_06570 [Hymenobacter sp.]